MPQLAPSPSARPRRAGPPARRCGLLAALGALAALAIPSGTAARAATHPATAAMPVSAVVLGGCTASFDPASPGGAHVDCPSSVPFSVQTMADAASRGHVVVVQY